MNRAHLDLQGTKRIIARRESMPVSGPGPDRQAHLLDVRYDPVAISRHDYANLVAGYFPKMPAHYRIVRPAGTQDWLVILTVSGAGVLRCGASKFLLRPHQIVLFKPSRTHDYGTDPAVGHWGLVWAHFHPLSSWQPLLDWPELAPGILSLDLPCGCPFGRQIIDGFKEMHRCSTGSSPRREWLATNALEGVLLRCEALASSAPECRDARLAILVRYIGERISDPISLADLARQVHLSISQVSALFRRHFNVSPQVYVERLRMEEAVRLLYSPGLSIKQVAVHAGFSDPLYFSKRFKKFFGVSPGCYRNERVNRVTLQDLP